MLNTKRYLGIVVTCLLFMLIFAGFKIDDKYTNELSSEVYSLMLGEVFELELDAVFEKYYKKRQEQVYLPVDKQVSILNSLGITELTFERANQHMAEVKEFYESLTPKIENEVELDYIDFLSSIGVGYYDYDANNWTPTSKQVYSFDMEIFDISSMYTNFMKGVIAISDGEFEITALDEYMDEADFVDDDTGFLTLLFKYNENSYTFKGRFHHDWIDLSIIDFMNDVFEKENNPKRLLFTLDHGQGCIIFYNTIEWAKQFAEKTLYPLQISTEFDTYVE